MKIAKLNRKNWIKVKESNGNCYYRHKTRKKVTCVYSKKTGTCFFKDTKANKIISDVKLVRWI